MNAGKSNCMFVPSLVFTITLLGFYLTNYIFPGPEVLFLCLFVYASYVGSGNRFVKTFSPFIISFLSYEALNRLIDVVPRGIHIQEPLIIDSWMFRAVPTIVLQQFRTPILDFMGAAFYSMHFIAPTIFAFLLWRYKPEHYQRYTFAFVICTYSALLTFLVYPVAPPWYGLKATRILFQIDHILGVPMFKTLYDYVGVNPFAAFPSLHSAFPWLIAVFALKAWRKKALPVLVLPVGIWFSAVYLGEHYVIDVMGGIAYATLAFLFAYNKERVLNKLVVINSCLAKSLLDNLEKVRPPLHQRENVYIFALKRVQC